MIHNTCTMIHNAPGLSYSRIHFLRRKVRKGKKFCDCLPVTAVSMPLVHAKGSATLLLMNNAGKSLQKYMCTKNMCTRK